MATPTLIAATCKGFAVSAAGPTDAINTTGATQLRLIVVSTLTSGSPPTPSDSKGNSWTADGTPTTLSPFPGTVFCFKTTGAPTVGTGHTFSATGNNETTLAAFAVGPGGGGTVSASTYSGAEDATSPYTSPGVTPASAEALLVAFGATNGVATITRDWSGSSFTQQAIETNQNLYWGASIATRAVSSIASYTASFTDNTSDSTSSVVGLWSFTETGGGGGGGGAFFVNLLFREAMKRARRKWRRSPGGLLVPA